MTIKKLITDEGVVEKKNLMSDIVMWACIAISIALIVLGVLAYLV